MIHGSHSGILDWRMLKNLAMVVMTAALLKNHANEEKAIVTKIIIMSNVMEI